MNKEIQDLINEIIDCPNIKYHYNNHCNDCSKVIKAGNETNIKNFQLPEPFSGEIDKAQVLFISSNPSIDLTKNEKYPTYNWKRDDVIDFFYNRFIKYIPDGLRSLKWDGTYSNAIKYETEIKSQANDYFRFINSNRVAIPGKDYCLTEIVHCKSQKRIGVNTAVKNCFRYLKKVIKISIAPLLVIVGKDAKELFCKEYGFEKYLNKKLSKPEDIEGIQRLIYFMSAPGGKEPRKIDKALSTDELETLKDWIIKKFV